MKSSYNWSILSARKSISTKKRPEGRSLSGVKDLLILLGLALLRIRSVLLLYSFIELGGNENHSVVLDSLGILPFLWLEIALYSEECSLDQAVE